MDKIKRILAITGAVILAGMYIATFIMSLLDRSESMTWFKGCIALTIFVPVVAYGYLCIHRYAINRSKRKDCYSQGSSPAGTSESDVGSEQQ